MCTVGDLDRLGHRGDRSAAERVGKGQVAAGQNVEILLQRQQYAVEIESVGAAAEAKVVAVPQEAHSFGVEGDVLPKLQGAVLAALGAAESFLKGVVVENGVAVLHRCEKLQAAAVAGQLGGVKNALVGAGDDVDRRIGEA